MRRIPPAPKTKRGLLGSFWIHWEEKRRVYTSTVELVEIVYIDNNAAVWVTRKSPNLKSGTVPVGILLSGHSSFEHLTKNRKLIEAVRPRNVLFDTEARVFVTITSVDAAWWLGITEDPGMQRLTFSIGLTW